jgi:hypothetical protein
MSLEAALNVARPGDLFEMLEGIYQGEFVFSANGSAEAPIVFRARPGHRVVIQGAIEIRGAHTWLWGLEITDPEGRSSLDSGIALTAPGAHVINNIVHHQAWKNGIGAWNTGAGQVIYGNLVYENGQGPAHPHNIYAQNDVAANGMKYIVDNVFLDSREVCGDCFNFHAYTERGFVEGLYLEGNVVANGRFLIGGFNEPAEREVVVSNYFYNSSVELGYRRPTQVEFRDNYLVRTPLDTQWFWGAGETEFAQSAPNVYTGNEIYLPADAHVRFRTSAYLSGERCEGCPAIRPEDTFDRNVYSAPFSAAFFANNNDLGTVDFEEWKRASRNAGNAFDLNSRVVETPTETKTILVPNSYDRARAHLIVYNWGASPNAMVDLAAVVENGSGFAVYRAKDVFGLPVASGTYAGPISVPLGGSEFSVFVVVVDQNR